MVEHAFDWPVIRSDYERGVSLSALERQYGVSRQAIKKHVLKEAWLTPELQVTVPHVTKAPIPEPLRFPVPDDAVSIARIGLSQLAKHLHSEYILEIKDHKSLSDALAQYVKVITTAPQMHEETTDWTVALNKLSPATRAKIRQALAEDEQREEAIG